MTRDPRREPRPRLLALLLLALSTALPAGAASFPPELRFRTLKTPRVTLHYHQGLEAMAREAAALADEILAGHERRYGRRVGRVHVALVDVEDDPNGFATPLPYPLVQIRAVAPRGNDDLGNHDGWLRVLLTHELAHVVHLDQARGLPGAARKVFGRMPFFFPNAATPTWMVEGLATDEETEGTAFGRGRNPDSRMILRMAALEGDFLVEDEAVGALDRWPSGQAAYLFGEAFLRDLSDRFGAGTVPELARAHSGHLIPYLDDFTAKKVTGSTFHTLWREWAARARADFASEAARIEARGLTPSCALTDRGIRQTGPRYSPDGARIAYTSRTLTRFRAIRVMAADGSGDRKLADRNGGTTLSWTPDGRRIVFDELERHRTFFQRSDLRVVDVATGTVRALTRGLRAKEPDVSPDGRTIVFVLHKADRSELALVDADGSRLRELTRSGAGHGVERAAMEPGGRRGGRLAVDGGGLARRGARGPRRRRRGRADPRPRQGRRAGVDAGRRARGLPIRSGRGLERLRGAAGRRGAAPRHQRAGRGLHARGVPGRRAASSSRTTAPRATTSGAWTSTSPRFRPRTRSTTRTLRRCPLPAPVTVADTTYRPLRHMRPHFWAPYFTLGDETKVGAATGGIDPLFRHAWGLDVHGGTETHRVGFHGFYQYDRFRPTFLLTLQDDTDPVEPSGLSRTRELTLRASLPVRRRVRSSQNVSLAWRRSRETLEGTAEPMRLELGGLEAAWSMSTVKGYPYSISPIDGYSLQVAVLKEDPALGSDVSLTKASADARAYVRLFGETDTLALRLGGGTTFGRPSFTRSYAVGGFPDGSLLDVVRTNPAVLRGYPQNGGADPRFTGRNFVAGNLEYRFPLVRPQRGWRALPVFLRHLHGAVFADVGHAWTGEFRMGDVKTGLGAALGADTSLGHVLPFTGVLGVARGLADRGETEVYFRVGLAF